MSKTIKKLYTSKGIKPPVGKGIHTEKFHAMATSIKASDKSLPMKSAYAIAMSKLGPEKAVKAAHRRYGKVNDKAKSHVQKSKGCTN